MPRKLKSQDGNPYEIIRGMWEGAYVSHFVRLFRKKFNFNCLTTQSVPRFSASQSSPRTTARKSTGGPLTPEKSRVSRNEAIMLRTRASMQKSQSPQPSTSFAVDNTEFSEVEEIPQGRPSRRQNTIVNQQASTSANVTSVTLPGPDSSDGDLTDVLVSTPVRSSPRTQAKTNNARGRQPTSSNNSVISIQASTSNRRNTSDSEEEESGSSDGNNSRRRSSRRASQRTANQSIQSEEHISDYAPETPDSDDDVPLQDRSPAKRKRTAARSKRSQVHQRKKRTTSDSSDEENVGHSTPKKQDQTTKPNTSIRSQSLKKGKIDSVDMSTLKNLAQKCVYYLLIEDQKKYAIKRNGIITSVFKDQKFSSKVYIAMLKEVNNILKNTYGLELIQLENRKDSYLIVNILERELGIEDFFDFSRPKQQHYGFVLYLLTVIFMNGNSISENELWKALKPLGIDPSSQKLHPIFGDVRKYITSELVKQMYLECKTVSADTGEREFVWGVRAKAEVDKRDLLDFTCEVMNISTPEQWILQYQDAQESAKEVMNNDNSE